MTVDMGALNAEVISCMILNIGQGRIVLLRLRGNGSGGRFFCQTLAVLVLPGRVLPGHNLANGLP